MQALLGFQQLCIQSSEGVKLVQNLDLEILPGEVIGVIGESGSGKTLSFQTALGVLPTGLKVTGRISWGNQSYDLANNVPYEVWRGKGIGYLWQEPLSALNPVSSIGTQVREAILRAPSRAKVLELFRMVRLNDPEAIYDSYPHQISGGQRQRALLAMAIANQPSLVIADEPTSGLDEELQEELIQLFRDLRKEQPHLSLVLISHDLYWTSKLATRVMVMKAGQVVDDCKVDLLTSNERHPYTKALLTAQYNEPSEWNRLPWTEFQGIRKGIGTQSDNSDAPITVLDVQDLGVGYTKGAFWNASYIPVFEHVNFKLQKGECIGIQGPSGVGKSSLARALLRLIPARTGKVMVRGTDWLPLDESSLRPFRLHMQIIFQDPVSALNPRLTVFEQLKDVLLLKGITDKEEQVHHSFELLSRVGLPSSSMLYRYPHEFSGGQRQRIAIARALAAKPDVLVCDEPIAALDKNSQAQVLNVLADLRDQGLSILFIAHERYAVEFLSDCIATLGRGGLDWVRK